MGRKKVVNQRDLLISLLNDRCLDLLEQSEKMQREGKGDVARCLDMLEEYVSSIADEFLGVSDESNADVSRKRGRVKGKASRL